MALGKSIKIHLKDGTVTGIKTAEVINQTIRSISCPRSRIAELSQLQEAKRPGVYFLFGQDDATNDQLAYIGEAENVFDRIQNHIANKDFWNEIIIFLSKDENLTKSHVKYLESRIVQIALSTRRYKIENSNQPQLPLLPAADIDAMEEFLIYIKLLVGVLGHKFLENVTTFEIKKVDTTPISAPTENNQVISTLTNLELYLSASGLRAKAVQTDEGIVVLEGSEAAKDSTTSQFSYRELRERLIKNGILRVNGDKHVFQSDYLFDTASPAAAVVVGYNINGRNAWKDNHGRTLNEIERDKIAASQ